MLTCWIERGLASVGPFFVVAVMVLMGQGEESIPRLMAGTPYGVDFGKSDEETQ